MMSASAGAFGSGVPHFAQRRGPKRAVEVLGVLVAFFWFWPAAAAYVTWKIMGYPGLDDLRASFDRGASAVRGYRFSGPAFDGTGFGGSGNAAFDEYRRSELERLERERARLDQEAREFRSFVEDLKRAKDREQFDAYMARRRQNGPTTA